MYENSSRSDGENEQKKENAAIQGGGHGGFGAERSREKREEGGRKRGESITGRCLGKVQTENGMS